MAARVAGDLTACDRLDEPPSRFRGRDMRGRGAGRARPARFRCWDGSGLWILTRNEVTGVCPRDGRGAQFLGQYIWRTSCADVDVGDETVWPTMWKERRQTR
jgi:hypothetical protein